MSKIHSTGKMTQSAMKGPGGLPAVVEFNSPQEEGRLQFKVNGKAFWLDTGSQTTEELQLTKLQILQSIRKQAKQEELPDSAVSILRKCLDVSKDLQHKGQPHEEKAVEALSVLEYLESL